MFNISRGSVWHRWEPHIHAPGTILNDQFKGDWGAYLKALESQTPKIEAIAVTDYYVTDTYEKLQEHKEAGRLPRVSLLFPNIEMRLLVGPKRSPVNVHLLVSPEDSNHLAEVKRILKRLTFKALGDEFDCTREELIKLGKHCDATITDEVAALRHGIDQFKVDFKQLQKVIAQSEWAKNNILVAVSGGSNDGISSMRGGYTTVRQGIERFADIVFSSNPADREFWLGRGKESPRNLHKKYGGCKPCLHGSDAHKLKSVGQPDGNRFCWIKGDLTFDALRHACINPEGRTYVGEQPPHSATPSQVISRVKINNAKWAGTPEIILNPGLVAIIGARGSGKTALADVIAAGCDAATTGQDADKDIRPSFLMRAHELLGDAETSLTWGDGDTVLRRLDGKNSNNSISSQRARYLSQQFVEELCSATDISDKLVSEIERVIFKSHSQDDHDKALDFADLRDQKITRFQQAHKREVELITRISDRIAAEMEKESRVANLSTEVKQKKKLIAGYAADKNELVVKDNRKQAERYTLLNQAAQDIRGRIQLYESHIRTLEALQDEVQSMRATGAAEMLSETRARHPNSGLNDEQWDSFTLIYKGKVDDILTDNIALAKSNIRKLKGDLSSPDGTAVPASDNIPKPTLAPIVAEMKQLETALGTDKLMRERFTALTNRIAKESTALQGIEARLADAKGASARRKNLQTERNTIYGRIFESIINEQKELASLYKPLTAKLAASSGTLKKLKFSVGRVANVQKWGALAEKELLDLRKSGPFHGSGSLIDIATKELKPAWEKGSASEIRAAMEEFIDKYLKDPLSYAPYTQAQQDKFRDWSKRFAHWLFSTDHITVRYEISYSDIDIRKLSPGMRGIVLLLLYLDLDDSDDRPLIIDQPEENLDPKSVFNELVDLFVAAKAKRQVIIVTHNANLVVNTDADQIIVAKAAPRTSQGLPLIKYTAGGLEDAAIRKEVCDILEGGEAAFHERARRLHVRLE